VKPWQPGGRFDLQCYRGRSDRQRKWHEGGRQNQSRNPGGAAEPHETGQFAGAGHARAESVKDADPVAVGVRSVECAAAAGEARIDHEVDMRALRLCSREEPLP
jgi:hypothetical protein